MPERVAAGVLGAHLGVIAVRFDLYNRARNGTANGYERPAHQVGGGMEFDNPRATENARGDPSLVGAREQRRRHGEAERPPRMRIHPLAKLPTCREHCFAIHYPIPDGWMNPNFDDSKWPRAFEYLDQEVGIMGVPGYWRYPEAFIGSRWIWTINLVFDNTVLLRKTVR